MKTLIILADSYKDSPSVDIANEYEKGALEKNNQVKRINLSELKFDLAPKSYTKNSSEKDILRAQELLDWATHLVFIFPITWAAVPAILKGFIDTAFVENFAFERDHVGEFIPLLIKKSARLIVTGEESKWTQLFSVNPAITMMKAAVLEHCGVSSVSVTYLGHVDELSNNEYQSILYQVFRLGLDEN